MFLNLIDVNLSHLALASGGLLHGRTELDVLVLALHLVIDLLNETSPRRALALALTSRLTTTALLLFLLLAALEWHFY